MKSFKFINYLNEIGDLSKIEPYDYDVDKDSAEFKTSNGENVRIFIKRVQTSYYHNFDIPPVFDKENSGIYNIGFSINDVDSQYRKTDYRELIRIIKTVALSIKKMLETRPFDEDIYVIGATDKFGFGKSDHQKLKLYKAVIQKNLPNNYRMGDGKYINHDLIVFKRR